MTFRIHPLWWPLLTIASPVLAPMLLVRNRRFKENRERAKKVNIERINKAEPFDLPGTSHTSIITI